jgi:hypothetical protein
MEDRFVVDIMDFERTHQMWSFLCQKYESTVQSTYLAAIHQEQLLRQGDTTSCRDQTAALELRDEFEPFRPQLLAHRPCLLDGCSR